MENHKIKIVTDNSKVNENLLKQNSELAKENKELKECLEELRNHPISYGTRQIIESTLNNLKNK